MLMGRANRLRAWDPGRSTLQLRETNSLRCHSDLKHLGSNSTQFLLRKVYLLLPCLLLKEGYVVGGSLMAMLASGLNAGLRSNERLTCDPSDSEKSRCTEKSQSWLQACLFSLLFRATQVFRSSSNSFLHMFM